MHKFHRKEWNALERLQHQAAYAAFLSTSPALFIRKKALTLAC